MIGVWLNVGEPLLVEAIRGAGIDYGVIDLQHGMCFEDDVPDLLRALESAGIAGLVRVRENRSDLIGWALDAGAQSVIVPLVNLPADAEAAVEACEYPPRGRRSFGPTRKSLVQNAEQGESRFGVGPCIVMIETAQGVANAMDIAAVDGLGGIYIGPSDLSMSLYGEVRKAWGDSRLESLVKDVVDAGRQNNIVVGLHCRSGAEGRLWYNAGLNFVTLGSVVDFVRRSVHCAVDEFHSA